MDNSGAMAPKLAESRPDMFTNAGLDCKYLVDQRTERVCVVNLERDELGRRPLYNPLASLDIVVLQEERR